MKRISILACILGVWFVSTAWAQQPATEASLGAHIQQQKVNRIPGRPDLAASRRLTAQAEDTNGAAAPARQNRYSFRTIDVPFGQPGVDIDMQCLLRSDSGIVVAQYQIPRSGACCGGPGFTENDHTAVHRRGRWTNIDVSGALTTLGSNSNEQGQVVLTYKYADGIWHIAIHSNRGLTVFPTPADYPAGIQANGINDRGVVAGLVLDAAGHSHGYIGDGVHYKVLDYPGATDTFFTKVADTGIAAGYYGLADGSLHAFRYKFGQFSTIDPAGSAASGVAVALSINNAGEISGAYFDAGGSLIGFLFDEGRFTDFQVPDAPLTIPWSINDHGEIAGIYAGGDGVYHGFVAEPVR